MLTVTATLDMGATAAAALEPSADGPSGGWCTSLVRPDGTRRREAADRCGDPTMRTGGSARGWALPRALALLSLGWLRSARSTPEAAAASSPAAPLYAVCRLPRHDTWTSQVPLKRAPSVREPCARQSLNVLLDSSRRCAGDQPYDLEGQGGAVNLAVQVKLPLAAAPSGNPLVAVIELWRGEPGSLGHLCGTSARLRACAETVG